MVHISSLWILVHIQPINKEVHENNTSPLNSKNSQYFWTYHMMQPFSSTVWQRQKYYSIILKRDGNTISVEVLHFRVEPVVRVEKGSLRRVHWTLHYSGLLFEFIIKFKKHKFSYVLLITEYFFKLGII